ncbi:transglutaminase family protein [Pseudohoeflea coraliihabitans]|uniref:Transglutaminase family protein n=1 Tax=Pseudohoeflea coraliihabitans TaxID=2860393 RepID=A0ABS6WM24_9HYPH|nr:transglutaminase family protein [Pseudohoeflea sp. DP4N28-3]MBW3097009.1 transglutaminase family protein [Pseudohoeflea sp. DP4N28-3]
MLLKISHMTEYTYTSPVNYALQRLRLTPADGATQKVVNWSSQVIGATIEARYSDHFGNVVELASIADAQDKIRIMAMGTVETFDTAGITGRHTAYMPLWLYQRETALTRPGPAIRALTRSIAGDTDLDRLHGLKSALNEAIHFETGQTHAGTSAEDALTAGHGVCQDHAHTFIAAARLMGLPARYVSGYLHMPGTEQQVASHAWAEAHVEGLGWVGFDAANDQSPDENYVVVAHGFDYHDAAPVSGVQAGASNEMLSVTITVEQ